MSKQHSAAKRHTKMSSRRAAVAVEPRWLKLDLWLSARRRVVLLVLVALATTIRVSVFLELHRTPLAHLEQWRESDMHVYDAWARTIVAGDWLSANVRVPMHSWHHGVARQYFADHPEAQAEIEREVTLQGRESDELLWSRWMHVPELLVSTTGERS